MPDRASIAVLGGSGYVAGEAVRILAQHPKFKVAALAGKSSIGVSASELFPHLTGLVQGLKTEALDEVLSRVSSGDIAGVVSALPHGESREVLTAVRKASSSVAIVDLSADFRFADGWTTGVPELLQGPVGLSASHPGCFATCTTLAIAPLVKAGWGITEVTAFGVTGSTGSGRTPKATTHHPERHSGFWAYDPLTHRHAAEITTMLDSLGGSPRLSFVPHSAPISRGMHVTVVACSSGIPGEPEALDEIQRYYHESPLITVRESLPSVKDVVGSNRCHISVRVHESSIAITSVIDNLIKGAAGGGVQLLNRMFGYSDVTGLDGPALGWN